MGLFRRFRKGARRVKNGLVHIHREAGYPGRPASYQATDNPLWADDDVVRVTTGQGAPVRADDAGDSSGAGNESGTIAQRTERPWFLDGEASDEGWDGTNPDEAWSVDSESD